MNKETLKQLFTENSDCYTEVFELKGTEEDNKLESDEIPAMTESKFIEVVGRLMEPERERGITITHANAQLSQPTTKDAERLAEVEYPYISQSIDPINAQEFNFTQYRFCAAFIKGYTAAQTSANTDGWISVEEGLPGNKINCWFTHKKDPHLSIGYYHPLLKEFRSGSVRYDSKYISYYLPIAKPQPPKI